MSETGSRDSSSEDGSEGTEGELEVNVTTRLRAPKPNLSEDSGLATDDSPYPEEQCSGWVWVLFLLGMTAIVALGVFLVVKGGRKTSVDVCGLVPGSNVSGFALGGHHLATHVLARPDIGICVELCCVSRDCVAFEYDSNYEAGGAPGCPQGGKCCFLKDSTERAFTSRSHLIVASVSGKRK